MKKKNVPALLLRVRNQITLCEDIKIALNRNNNSNINKPRSLAIINTENENFVKTNGCQIITGNMKQVSNDLGEEGELRIWGTRLLKHMTYGVLFLKMELVLWVTVAGKGLGKDRLRSSCLKITWKCREQWRGHSRKAQGPKMRTLLSHQDPQSSDEKHADTRNYTTV